MSDSLFFLVLILPVLPKGLLICLIKPRRKYGGELRIRYIGGNS